jgi:hypothetical protein
MVKDAKRYEEMFAYLSSPDMPSSSEPTVVFGRKDPLVAHALGDLVIPNLVEIAVITGGIGKDSGDLLDLGFDSESSFLDAQLKLDATDRGYGLPEVIVEKDASNGRENARNSIAILHNRGIAIDSLTAVAHATSALRLAETLKFEAMQLSNDVIPTVHRAPSAYNFDVSNPSDRKEAASELLRLADWPTPVKSWQTAILRHLPKSAQLRVINFAANHSRK